MHGHELFDVPPHDLHGERLVPLHAWHLSFPDVHTRHRIFFPSS
jgi:hypothetical protein